MPHFRLTLAYDGTDFYGSQVQGNERTVQGELDRALTTLGGEGCPSRFAGRTDRGVHAAGQVAAVSLPRWSADTAILAKALQSQLPGDIGIGGAAECASSFHPRFDAVWREYRYWLCVGVRDPFLARVSWQLRSGIDLDAVTEGMSGLSGAHDFASFACGGEGVPWSERSRMARGTVRTIYTCEGRRVSLQAGPGVCGQTDAVELRFVADGFLPRMVRSMTAALVEIGQGRRSPTWIREVLAAKDRRAGPGVAPPQGLSLWKIGYGSDAYEVW
jgi:tRNA pseudouridine38-40 synthase